MGLEFPLTASNLPDTPTLPETEEGTGRVRRIGSLSGFLMFLILDLLALDDITTAGAWMPEIMIVICSIPALVTLGYYASKPATRPRRIEDGSHSTALPSGRVSKHPNLEENG